MFRAEREIAEHKKPSLEPEFDLFPSGHESATRRVQWKGICSI